MRDYYEQFYELYGRKVDLQFFVGSGIASDEVAARADAVRIAEEIQPFAVLGGPALTAAFGDELSSRGMLCISCNPSQPADWYADRDPYNFGIAASARQMNVHVDRVHQQAARRQERRVRRRRVHRRRRASSASCTSSRAPNRRPSPTSSSPAQRAGHRDRGAPPVPARPGDDPGLGGADHRQAEGVRRHHGDLQRRSGRTRRLHP